MRAINTGATAANLALQMAHARLAAMSGLEAARHRVLHAGVCADWNSPGPGVLTGFTVSVRCRTHSALEAGHPVTLYDIATHACNEPAAGACPNPSPLRADYAAARAQLRLEP